MLKTAKSPNKQKPLKNPESYNISFPGIWKTKWIIHSNLQFTALTQKRRGLDLNRADYYTQCFGSVQYRSSDPFRE